MTESSLITPKNLKPGSHIHLMGICGTAMASLAGLLKGRGYKVTGSDSNPYPPMSTQLEKLEIPIMKGYRKENLTQDPPDFVIVGNVISRNNEEAKELERLSIPFTSLPKAVGELIIDQRDSFVVAGTHGKTTTTSLLAWVTTELGLKPGFLIGGIPKNFSVSFRNPEADTFVIEGDEYDTAYFDKVPKFIHYKPKHVIFTSLEFDHADIYNDLQAVKDAFLRLMKLIPSDGSLLFWADQSNVVEVQGACTNQSKFGYGLKKGDYIAKVTKIDEGGTDFEVQFRGKRLGSFRMALGGDYNVLNATSVIAMAHQRNWNLDKVRQALLSFQGVKRRQEILGEPKGVLVIEDFAHHPTAVRETILGIQNKYPGRKFFSVFEPRSATSRRKIFQKEYFEAFSAAHEVILAEAFDQSKIDSEDRFSSAELMSELQAAGKSARVFSTADEIVSDLLKRAKSGDGILIMSNGGFDGIYGKLLKGLEVKTP
jgi:UDP-N-acetylmuramate: L-alanyl-gamma-D-glutamyl-meso-diaminopimelate ligase